MKQVIQISIICTLLASATPAEASFLKKLGQFTYKATTYITTCWRGPSKTKLSKADKLFYNLNHGKKLSLQKNVTIFPDYHYKENLIQHYALLYLAQTKLSQLQNQQWPNPQLVDHYKSLAQFQRTYINEVEEYNCAYLTTLNKKFYGKK